MKTRLVYSAAKRALSIRMSALVAFRTTLTAAKLSMLAVVLTVNVAFTLNNLAPYLGWPYHGPMTMYSNLSANADNHLLLGRLGASNAATYARLVEYEPGDVPALRARRFQDFAAWTLKTERQVNLNLLSYQVARVCGSSPPGPVRLVVDLAPGGRREYRDACGELAMNGPRRLVAILSSYPSCRPGCDDYLRDWASTPRR